MRLVPVLLVAVLLTGCTVVDGESATQTTSGGITSNSAATSISPDEVATSPAPTASMVPGYEVEDCSDAPPIDFVVLCEVYPDVIEFYVDPVEPAQLVSAALLGMTNVPTDPAAEVPSDGFRCVIPDPVFEQLCEQMAERFATAPATSRALMEGAVHGMFRYALDPFSTYIAGSVLDVPFDLSGSIPELGITVGARDDAGAACGPIGETCRFRVLSVFDFGPAGREGIAIGDEIVAIDGEPVVGLSGDEAAAQLVGISGTEITVTIVRDDLSSDRQLVRQDIRYQPAEFEMLGDVAYLRLNEFSQISAKALGDVLQTQQVSSALGIVLDLRDNPGGLVLAAQAVASQFLEDGRVLIEHGRDFVEEIDVLPGGYATTGPQMVVLVNRGTASSAEIVAAVLQERSRAVVVGEPTFGKNLVQYVSTTRDGGQVALTIARWSTPGGLDIGLRGLQPDIEVEAAAGGEGDAILEAGLAMLGG